MRLNVRDYRDKLLGCWLGKNAGGTLGAPFEWQRQVNRVTFYTQELKDGALPNDDLDIQLLWLIALEERGLDLNARTLADYWCLYVTPHWAEYGIAKINLRAGLPPPLSGAHRNAYRHSCGSFIRSEIWAAIAPGLPAVAARYAYEDAILDHGNGEGVYAEVFMAALESAAFVAPDLRTAIEVGLSYLPADCGVAAAVRTALECFDGGQPWLESRDEVLRRHRGRLTAPQVSADDRAKGFATGVQGYDAPSNIGLTLIGLLYGGADFGQTLCVAVNCGEDTDCTAASAGAVWGILHGARKMPPKWLDPIGRGIKTVCLNVGDLSPWFGVPLPQTVDELTERTAAVARRLLTRQNALHLMSDEPTDLQAGDLAALRCANPAVQYYGHLRGPRFEFDFFTVDADYGPGPTIRQGQAKKVRFTIHNRYKVQANLSLHWYLPEGWTVAPASDGWALSVPPHFAGPVTLDCEFRCDRLARAVNRAVLEITIAGRPTLMLVPLILLSEVEAAPEPAAE